MKRWSYQQNAYVGGCAADDVVCPKPRKVGVPLHFHEPMRPPSRLIHVNNQPGEACDSKAGIELLDIIRMKGNYGPKRSNFQVASSPPFFVGSPPSRASNPVIQDEQFGNGNDNPPCSRKSGGCVRIEGFNCRGNSSVSALA